MTIDPSTGLLVWGKPVFGRTKVLGSTKREESVRLPIYLPSEFRGVFFETDLNLQ